MDENEASSRLADGVIRWSVITNSLADPAVNVSSVNRRGFSHLLVAAMGDSTTPGSYGFKMNADHNDKALTGFRVAMPTYLGGRYDSVYDHTEEPSGPKWGNELAGNILGQLNVKGPNFGLTSATPGEESDYYLWGQHDQVTYRAGVPVQRNSVELYQRTRRRIVGRSHPI